VDKHRGITTEALRDFYQQGRHSMKIKIGKLLEDYQQGRHSMKIKIGKILEDYQQG
jgi:hypothetical protein